jgi:acetyl esterase/lipase
MRLSIWPALLGAALTAQDSPSTRGPRRGDLLLESADARIEGTHLAYIESVDCIGCWANPKAKVKWTLNAPESGKFTLIVTCSHGHGPSEYVVSVGDKSFSRKIEGKGSDPDWFEDTDDVLGEIDLVAGRSYDVSVRATSMPHGPLLNLRRVVFRKSGAPLQPLLLPDVDISYREAAGQRLKLDLAVPEGSGPFPAVMCIHGGGWEGGSHRQYDRLIREFARRGFVGVTVGYRVAPAHNYPAALDDLAAALEWIRNRAPNYRIDPKRIGVMGDSAGGHLAALLGTTQGRDSVKAVVAWYGIFDLPAYWKRSLTPQQPKAEAEFARKISIQFLGGSLDDAPERYREASPVTHVTSDDPPMMLIHGTRDTVVPFEQAELLKARLDEAKVPVELVRMEGALHGFRGKPFHQANESMFRFFEANLR